ncbi:hypothetical protein [Geobacter sulfurreducens]|uniref:hypothetical protein n=1 Tax=Geobacter sulfurreducens TaxID=35554 RepID=UPI000DBB99B5|nr:hypothetical protein [Geobacter sulfurreducens]BBA71779.1 hypothetical protein YM18_3271 [Geobacter sulfurreducens]
MSGRPISAGDIIEARCTKCRAVYNHTIVAMIGTRVVRVQCNTCGGQHNYHSPQEEKKTVERSSARRPVGEKPRRASAVAGPSEWEHAMEGRDPASAVPYAMDASFRVDALVNHPTFGIGIVTAVIKPNKVEILFRDGKKLLRCSL